MGEVGLVGIALDYSGFIFTDCLVCLATAGHRFLEGLKL
jgi:hypothetical protein